MSLLSRLFGKRPDDRAEVRPLWHKIVELSRDPAWYAECRVADTVPGRFDAIIALGALVRGETPHFEVLAAECAKGLAQVSLASGIPVSFGVITADTPEQAEERAGGKAGNKGWDAALAAVEMVGLLRRLA